MPAHGGKTKMEHITHVKYILPVEQLISCLLDYNKFGYHNKWRLDPKYIPNLKLIKRHNLRPVKM